MVVNFTFLPEVIYFGKPCNLTIYVRNKWATCVAALVLLQGTKCAILVKQSTSATMIDSYPLCVLDKPKTKSKLTESHGLSRIGRGVYNLVF